MRLFWWAFLLLGLGTVQLIHEAQTAPGSTGVLAYSTNVNRGDLLAHTNQQRASNGLGSLALNNALSQAAQAKANHMIAHNYWAHVAPDGTTPWSFFDQAGYNYTNAGENLAYGFADSNGVIQGWMNSSGHRANVLGDYKDIGFGYANGATFQGGENTVIVALYGTQPAPAPQPAPAVASASPQPPMAPPSQQPDAPTANPAPAANESALPPAPATPPKVPSAVSETLSPTEEPAPAPQPATTAPQTEQRVTTASALLSRQGSWPVLANVAIIVVATLGFITTNLQLLDYAWSRGLHWAGKHPLTDAAVLTSLSLLVMSSTVGYIR